MIRGCALHRRVYVSYKPHSSNFYLLTPKGIEGLGEVRKPLLLVKQIRSEGSELAVEKEFPSYSERVSVAKRSGRALPGA